MEHFRDLMFTPSVKAVQARMGSRAAYARIEAEGRAAPTPDVLGADEAAFLAERDSFYMASVGEGGWPYVQHRGGPKGFVRVLDEHRIGFADFRGNRQYISVGNLERDDRLALIFVDYPNQARLKILARASAITGGDDTVLLSRLAVPGYAAKIERAIILRVEGIDWNCPQHIVPRYSELEIHAALAPMRARIEELERENQELRRGMARNDDGK